LHLLEIVVWVFLLIYPLELILITNEQTNIPEKPRAAGPGHSAIGLRTRELAGQIQRSDIVETGLRRNFPGRNLKGVQAENKTKVSAKPAEVVGAPADEVIITRNTTESQRCAWRTERE
jgi:hypothetical protein